MSEFELFNRVNEKYNEKNKRTKSEEPELERNSCEHENTIVEKDMYVCTDCGEEIHKKFSNNKEWRYYGSSDNKHTSNPNRVQMRKQDEKNIFKDVENMNLSEKIIMKANDIYTQVTKGKIYRSTSRKAIIFACVFYAYKILKQPQTHEKLLQIFNIEQKSSLEGIKTVNLLYKNPFCRTQYITPVNFVEQIMSGFGATDEQKKEVIDLYARIKNKSTALNRSKPQSIASGLVYYWCCKSGKNISIQSFCKNPNIRQSQLTVSKCAKLIEEIIKNENKQKTV